MFQPKPLPRNLQAALRDARSPKTAVRRAAVRDLGRLARGEAWKDAAQALRASLRDDSHASIRAEAALALADGEVRVAVDDLILAAADLHPEVRQMALLALGELGARGHVDTSRVISNALSDAVPELRFQALIAAVHLELPGIGARLEVAFGDEDAQVRYIALRLADEVSETQGGLRATVRDAASLLLGDDVLAVRAAAVILLGGMPRERCAAVLAEAINSNLRLPAPEDEQALIELAGELGVTEAIHGLSRHAFGRFGLVPGRFAWQAKIALARLGDPRAQGVLLKSLKSRDRDARTVAVVAVGRARLTQAIPILQELRAKGSADAEALTEALTALDAD